MAIAPFTQASLITNGSFEQVTFEDNSTAHGVIFNTDLQAFDTKRKGWDIFRMLPGWVTSYGNGIELQKRVVTKSQDGNHHVELDSHIKGSSNSVMTQSLDDLIIGADYLLEFYYKPRTKRKNDNGINVFWYNAAVDFNISMDAILSVNDTKKNTKKWSSKSIILTAQSTSMDLSFGAFGKQNTRGGLIDNISLTHLSSNKGPENITQQNVSNPAVTSVPEPSVLVLFGAGLVMLIMHRRKYATKKA